MPTLTQRTADRAKPRARRYELSCSTVRGFILRVLPSGKKAYYVRYRTGDRDVRERLGSTFELTFVEARRRAVERLAEVHAAEKGELPDRTERVGPNRRRPEAPRRSEFVERFVAQHINIRLKPTTQLKYRQLLRTAILPAFGPRDVVKRVLNAGKSRDHPARRRRWPSSSSRRRGRGLAGIAASERAAGELVLEVLRARAQNRERAMVRARSSLVGGGSCDSSAILMRARTSPR